MDHRRKQRQEGREGSEEDLKIEIKGGEIRRVENMFIALVESDTDREGSKVIVRRGKMRICKKRGIFEAF